MTPAERRQLLAILDRQYEQVSPGDPRLGLVDLADAMSDAEVVQLVVDWSERILPTAASAKTYRAVALAERDYHLRRAKRQTATASAKRADGSASRRAKAIALEAAGRTRYAIAEELSIDRRTVDRYLSKKRDTPNGLT